jgi:hypothetical protein
MAVVDTVYNAFTMAHMAGGNRYKDAKVHATSRSRSLPEAYNLMPVTRHSFAFAQMYLPLFPCVPLDRLEINGDIPAIGIRDGLMEVIMIEPEFDHPNEIVEEGYLDEATKWYPELDLYVGITMEFMGRDTVRGRIFFPWTGSSIIMPCEGKHYTIAKALYHEDIRRRGSWCEGCTKPCHPELVPKPLIRDLKKSRRLTI